MCNLMVDGIVFNVGPFIDPIQAEYKASKAEVALISSILTGFYLIGGPFVSAIANKLGFRLCTIIGSVIIFLSFGLSYFATNVLYLYFVYGFFGGIGFCFIYMPAVLTVGYYFEKWRALATGESLLKPVF
jgi:MCP family monocarboxylic acid transporter-like MFS transporter 14